MEINASHFVIQRSEDGRVFKSVGTVEAKGNGTYQFKDPFTTSHLPFTIYYRLQIVGKNGIYTYSEIKQIRINQVTGKQINIYPNPATAIVSIDCSKAKQISIVDYLGRIVKQFNNPTTHQILNIKQLNKGIYLVKVTTNNDEIKTEKLIVE